MRLEVSLLFVITKLIGGILTGWKQVSKSFNVVYIGLPCSKMPIYIIQVAQGVNNFRKSVEEI